MKWKMFLSELWAMVKAFGKKRVDIVWLILAFVLVGFWQNDMAWRNRYKNSREQYYNCVDLYAELWKSTLLKPDTAPKAGEEVPTINEHD